jgi:hypothetical protein
VCKSGSTKEGKRTIKFYLKTQPKVNEYAKPCLCTLILCILKIERLDVASLMVRKGGLKFNP